MGYLILAGLALAYALGYFEGHHKAHKDGLTDLALREIYRREQNRRLEGQL